MEAIRYRLSHFALLIFGTIGAYFLTVLATDHFFPSRGCVSLKGVFWGIIYLAFATTMGVKMMHGKRITIWMLCRVLLICGSAPYLLFLGLTIL